MTTCNYPPSTMVDLTYPRQSGDHLESKDCLYHNAHNQPKKQTQLTAIARRPDHRSPLYCVRAASYRMIRQHAV